MTSYDILIATIPHRHERLCALLAGLDRQMQPGAGVRLYRDNLEHGIAAKRQALLESSAADYVSFVDDDDEIAPDFVPRVMQALAAGPDYVGFTVKVSSPEAPPVAYHSLRYQCWINGAPVLLRDISHLNPVRRELALRVRFDGPYGEDGRWADEMRAAGHLRTEVTIDGDPMYHYRNELSDSAKIAKSPLPEDQVQPLPSYPWLVTL